MRPARARQAVALAALRARGWIYARYPRYPQADSAWRDSIFMTASGCGRDDLPATEESLPSHSRSGCRAGRLRAAGQAEAKGRAADEAAARRKMRACPSADAKAAGFVKRPSEPGSLRAGGTGQAGHRTFGFRTSPAESGTSVSAPPPAEEGLRLRICRAGPGFGPGAAKPADPGFRSMDRQAEPEASAEDPAVSGTEASALGPRWREEGREFQIRRSGEPPGLRPWSGSPRGNRIGFGRGRTPEEAAPEPPVQAPPSRNRPARNASPPRLGSTRRDSGGRRQRRPPLICLETPRSAARLDRCVSEVCQLAVGRNRRAPARLASRHARLICSGSARRDSFARARGGAVHVLTQHQPAPGAEARPARNGSAAACPSSRPRRIISGDLATDAQLHVDGRIDGNVRCAQLIQGGGRRSSPASIHAEEARLAGTVEGTVSARHPDRRGDARGSSATSPTRRSASRPGAQIEGPARAARACARASTSRRVISDSGLLLARAARRRLAEAGERLFADIRFGGRAAD